MPLSILIISVARQPFCTSEINDGAAQMTKAQSQSLAQVHEILANGGRMTIAHIRDAAGWRHMPLWETEQLIDMGMIVRLSAQGCVDATYATVRQAKENGWK